MNWEAEMDKPVRIKKGGGFFTMREVLAAAQKPLAAEIVDGLLNVRENEDINPKDYAENHWLVSRGNFTDSYFYVVKGDTDYFIGYQFQRVKKGHKAGYISRVSASGDGTVSIDKYNLAEWPEAPYDEITQYGLDEMVRNGAFMKESVAVDLDGTLAKDSGWKGPEHIGEPVKPMLDLVNKLLDDGEDVVIFTARVHDGEKSTKEHIKQWLKDHDLPDLEITNEKRPDMEKFYDDKAVAVDKNKGVSESRGVTIKTLEKNKVDLDPAERKQVMKANAVYPFGKNGADSPAVHKAVVDGKTWYWSSTHRLCHIDKTLAAAIKNFFKIVEPSG